MGKIRAIATATALTGAALTGAVATPALASGTTTYRDAPAAISKVTTVKLINRKTGRCLDSNSRGKVYAHKCNSGDYQKWIVIKKTKYTRKLWNKKTKLCLDSNAQGKVYTHSCNNGNYQRWGWDTSVKYTEVYNLATSRCLRNSTVPSKSLVSTVKCPIGYDSKLRWQVKKV